MHFLAPLWAFVLVISVNAIYCAPATSGHFNAHALDFGTSLVDVEKDVVLSPGRGGNNFNAEAEDNGLAAINIGGTVHGFAANRTGEEFNAISRKQGISQVRVNGDLMIENLDPTARKFDAVANSGGKSMVQVGNVVILAGAKRQARQTETEAQRQLATETAWGAAAVADHNSKPWESVNHGAVGDVPVASHDPEVAKPHEATTPTVNKPEIVAPIIGDETHTPAPVVDSVSTVLPSSSTEIPSVVPDQSQTAEAGHQPESPVTDPVTASPIPSVTSVIPITSEKPPIVPETHKPHPTETLPVPELPENNNVVIIAQPHPVGGYSAGSLNAVSTGQGSKSVVLVKGFVQY